MNMDENDKAYMLEAIEQRIKAAEHRKDMEDFDTAERRITYAMFFLFGMIVGSFIMVLALSV